MLFIAVSAMAIPAHREHSTITQPDGTKLTIRLIGDEFYNFNTTVDGYTVVKNAAGVYEYAVREDNQLKASGVKARQVAERTVAEKAFLQSVTTYMTDRVEHAQGEAKRVKRDAPAAKAPINFSKFRGLIILINFSDVKFSMTNGAMNETRFAAASITSAPTSSLMPKNAAMRAMRFAFVATL